MSMSQDSENFEQLRRLIALKRHEQPPPGYYHHFSREVIVRIKAGDLGDRAGASWWSWEGSWMQRVWTAVETRPAVAGAFGVAVCGFFAVGALLSDNASTGFGQDQRDASGPFVANAPVSTPPWTIGDAAAPINLNGAGQPSAVSHSLFEEMQRLQQSQSIPQAFNVNYVPGN
jgi:hypothetical protein